MQQVASRQAHFLPLPSITSTCFTSLGTWPLQTSWYKVQPSTALPEGLLSTQQKKWKKRNSYEKTQKDPAKANPRSCCYWTEACNGLDMHLIVSPRLRDVERLKPRLLQKDETLQELPCPLGEHLKMSLNGLESKERDITPEI